MEILKVKDMVSNLNGFNKIRTDLLWRLYRTSWLSNSILMLVYWKVPPWIIEVLGTVEEISITL